MARARADRSWRPDADERPRALLGVWSAFLFNICLVLLPLASAFALATVARDHLYSYDLTPATQAAVRGRIERIASNLILIDFDRRRQWDEMIATELMKGDVAAARGFLLCAPAMLSSTDADQLNRNLHSNASDVDIEAAALDLLTPGTRTRYIANVPLLSRRSASGLSTTRALDPPINLGDARDFELLANSMLGDSDSDPLHFTLTGLGLGLGGALTPRMQAGAAALIAASRSPDFNPVFADEITTLVSAAAPAAAFRSAALTRAQGGADPASYPVASVAFRASIDPQRLAVAETVLDEIGAMSDATSLEGATLLLTHARSMRDLPRLRLVAQAAGDRATAVAKNAPHDGRLPGAARGVLSFNRDLMLSLLLAAAAAIGLAFTATATGLEALRRTFGYLRRDANADDDHDLVQSFDAPWRTL